MDVMHDAASQSKRRDPRDQPRLERAGDDKFDTLFLQDPPQRLGRSEVALVADADQINSKLAKRIPDRVGGIHQAAEPEIRARRIVAAGEGQQNVGYSAVVFEVAIEEQGAKHVQY